MLFPAVLFSFSIDAMGKIYRVLENTASDVSIPVLRRYFRIDKGENWWELMQTAFGYANKTTARAEDTGT